MILVPVQAISVRPLLGLLKESDIVLLKPECLNILSSPDSPTNVLVPSQSRPYGNLSGLLKESVIVVEKPECL